MILLSLGRESHFNRQIKFNESLHIRAHTHTNVTTSFSKYKADNVKDSKEMGW